MTKYLTTLYDVILRVWLRDKDGVSRQNEVLRRIALDVGAPQVGTLTTFYRGWCLAQMNRVNRGAAVMEEALRGLEAQNWPVWQPYRAALLADAYRVLGRAEDGLQLVDRGLTTIERTGERVHEPEQHRIRGELLLALDTPDPVEAEAAFRRAIEVARAQAAKSYELRASTSLARLLQDQGRVEEGRWALANAYEWFTAGFETADLVEARALLEELAG